MDVNEPPFLSIFNSFCYAYVVALRTNNDNSVLLFNVILKKPSVNQRRCAVRLLLSCKYIWSKIYSTKFHGCEVIFSAFRRKHIRYCKHFRRSSVFVSDHFSIKSCYSNIISCKKLLANFNRNALKPIF